MRTDDRGSGHCTAANIMRCIVASDYDGTLNCGGVSAENIEAIERLRKAGHLFGIVTGRDYVHGYELFKKRGEFPFDFIITHNGAQACDSDGNIIFTSRNDGKMKWKDSTLAAEFIRRCLELTGTYCGMGFEKSRYDFHPDLPEGGEIKGVKYSPLSILDTVGDFVMANARTGDADRTAKVTAELKREFGDVLNPIQNGVCIDITPVGIDKAVGISRLAEHLGVAHDNIWTAGDNYNDLPMVKAFHGCAMERGVDELKKEAEFVCASVADVINKILER